jgi:hypothetical protein
MSSSRILVMRHAENFLFATAASKHSRRPIETLKPLARRCDLKIDKTFADQDYGALALVLREKHKYRGALIVVCWHHGNIPPLAHALNAKARDYPNPWNRDVFNLILQFNLAGAVPTVKRVNEPF